MTIINDVISFVFARAMSYDMALVWLKSH